MKAQGLRTSVVLSKTRGSVSSTHAAVYKPVTPAPSTPLLMSMDTKHDFGQSHTCMQAKHSCIKQNK